MKGDRNVILRQFQQLQTLMHRMVYHGYTVEGQRPQTPYRGQGKVLALLVSTPELGQKQLCAMAGMSKQALAELLGKMERKGYIRRTPHPEDKRSVIVTLLPAGEQAARMLDTSAGELENIFDCLNDQEKALLQTYLERIIHSCMECFPGEDEGQKKQRMERFLAKYDHSFTHFDEGENRHGGKDPQFHGE